MVAGRLSSVCLQVPESPGYSTQPRVPTISRLVDWVAHYGKKFSGGGIEPKILRVTTECAPSGVISIML